MAKKKPKTPSATVTVNRKAGHDYTLEDRFEAGLALEGWEVKSLRAGRVQIKESYVTLKNSEAWLVGAHISALTSASTHVNPDPTRPRKLLLHRTELSRLVGAVERRGYSIVPLRMYWKYGRAKLEIALAKGKKQHDKRDAAKERDWNLQKQRVLRAG
jgi:SsrA-binding protein